MSDGAATPAPTAGPLPPAPDAGPAAYRSAAPLALASGAPVDPDEAKRRAALATDALRKKRARCAERAHRPDRNGNPCECPDRAGAGGGASPATAAPLVVPAAQLQEALGPTFSLLADIFHAAMLRKDDPRFGRDRCDDLAKVWAPILAPYIDAETAKLLPLAIAAGTTLTHVGDYRAEIAAARSGPPARVVPLTPTARPGTERPTSPPNAPLGSVTPEAPRA